MINKMVMSVLCWKGLQINMEITLMHQLKNSCRCCNKGSAAKGNCYIADYGIPLKLWQYGIVHNVICPFAKRIEVSLIGLGTHHVLKLIQKQVVMSIMDAKVSHWIDTLLAPQGLRDYGSTEQHKTMMIIFLCFCDSSENEFISIIIN